MDSGASFQEARNLIEQAEAAAKPKKWLLFSSAPDYLEASELYNKAGNAFKSCKEWQSAGDAFRRSAELEIKSGDTEDSSRKLLSAASCYKKCDPKLAVEVTQEAINMLIKSGRFHQAANQEKEIAEIYETLLEDPQNAIVYYTRAAERFEGEDSHSTAQGCLVKAAALSALVEDFDKAARIYEEVAVDSANDHLRKYSVRDYLLRAGICRLNTDDMIGAKRQIENYLAIDASFGGTREFKLLNDLLEAVENQDVEAFTENVHSFDKVNSLDDWKTKLLLRLKNTITALEDDLT